MGDILDRAYVFLGSRGLMLFDTDEKFLYHKFKVRMGYYPDLHNPKTYNEKLQWLKLHDRQPEYVTMVDKVAVKDYVADRIGRQYIIKNYGVWNRVEDIDFESLPNQFVLKCTHDSGGIVIVRDKEKLDRKAVKQKLNRCLRSDYYRYNREWPYKNVKPRILAEEYMQDNVIQEMYDYKFFCFDGKPEFLYVSRGLEDHSKAEMIFLNLDWKKTEFQRADFREFVSIPSRPDKLPIMIKIVRKLAQGIPFVRVDLYCINDRVYFSEFTFSPCSGFIHFKDEKYDVEIGELLQLPILKR